MSGAWLMTEYWINALNVTIFISLTPPKRNALSSLKESLVVLSTKVMKNVFNAQLSTFYLRTPAKYCLKKTKKKTASLTTTLKAVLPVLAISF